MQHAAASASGAVCLARLLRAPGPCEHPTHLRVLASLTTVYICSCALQVLCPIGLLLLLLHCCPDFHAHGGSAVLHCCALSRRPAAAALTGQENHRSLEGYAAQHDNATNMPQTRACCVTSFCRPAAAAAMTFYNNHLLVTFAVQACCCCSDQPGEPPHPGGLCSLPDCQAGSTAAAVHVWACGIRGAGR
jgi:hypothetical protein